ncbi:MAG: histidine phosphatase family protein, partial [Anaerovoracaceae bacterium]
RIFLLRHGEIQQHAGKIFLGQTDVPLSSQGKEDSRLLAEELKQEGLCTKQIYTGDLKRTVQTAEIVASLLDIGQIIQRPALREMALGAWDGKPIEEIKALYPEEYKKRGENLFTYKPDHHWESFFDLQYRVVKALKGILEEVTLQGETDIVIVAHKGVLRVIENNLDGKSVEFPWETIQPAKYRCKSY